MREMKKVESRLFSWFWSDEAFKTLLLDLNSTPPEKSSKAGLINSSSGKFVWRLKRSSGGKDFDFAYKINFCRKPWRYILKPSLAMREALNYRMFENLGIPVAHLLAVGDVRKNFLLHKSFVVTTFVADSRDGRVFMPGGELEGEDELRFEFTLRNMDLLAKIHDSGVFHKAFHPRNLLWKGAVGSMQIFWIDVARCRPIGGFMSAQRAVLVDLHTFFRDMYPRKAELEQAVEHYLQCRRNGGYPGGISNLLEDIYNFKRRPFSKKKYTVTR